MADKKRYFNPERVAELETAYLHARQDRKRLLMLRQAVRLAAEQFQVRLPRSFFAGNYYVTADDAWAAGDLDMTWNSLYRYFQLAQDASGLLFDPAVVGKLAVEARIAQQRVATSDDKSDWLNALIDLQMGLWRVPEVVARGAAQWRLRALTTLDSIARSESTDMAADWKKVEGDLQRSFKGVHALLTSL